MDLPGGGVNLLHETISTLKQHEITDYDAISLLGVPVCALLET
jgi:hypothetical protein